MPLEQAIIKKLECVKGSENKASSHSIYNNMSQNSFWQMYCKNPPIILHLL